MYCSGIIYIYIYIIIGKQYVISFPFIPFDTLILSQFPKLKVQFIKVTGVFVRASMMDAILVVGFGEMGLVVAAVYGSMISDIVVLVSSIFAVVALIDFGCTDSTGTQSPGFFTRFISISGSYY